MVCQVKVIEDSISEAGARITTVQLRYWRAIHAELMTHRAFSRNASSSRAIPVKKMLEQVWNDPAGPIHWGANQPGMQAQQQLTGWRLLAAKAVWKYAGRVACIFAWLAIQIGLHKQVANRLLEPWQYIHVLVTSTEWENFFALRIHPDAQPEMCELATAIKEAINGSRPVEREWHMPYITQEERSGFADKYLLRISAARCCRVSYLKHDGQASNIDEDLALADKLRKSHPIHASPFEHQAGAVSNASARYRNFMGWNQYRTLVENEIIFER
jgi:hypothetical protein